jgi:hypothetical protein
MDYEMMCNIILYYYQKLHVHVSISLNHELTKCCLLVKFLHSTSYIVSKRADKIADTHGRTINI